MPDCEEAAPFTTVTADVYCNMHNDRGGWVMIQRNYIHQDNDQRTVDFNKKWKDYEEGFGHLEGNFWYGLKSTHCLTQNNAWEMKIVFRWKNDGWHTIHYDQFSIGNADDDYRLTVGGFKGDDDITDFFASHQLNGMKFSTPDRDNDLSSGNCAAQFKGGWWYNNCTDITLNTKVPHMGNNRVVYSEMIIRPKGCIIN